MEWIASVQTVLQEWEKNNSQVLQELQEWFRAIPLDKKWEIVLMLLGCVWIIRTVNERSGASKKAKRAKNKGSRYWRPEENQFIGPAHEEIPREWYWDECDCRWLPPEHPDHPNNKKKMKARGQTVGLVFFHPISSRFSGNR